MKRVLASLLFLVAALQAETSVPQSSAASQQSHVVSVAQSPYDFRFHIEQGEWDQVDATLRRIPTNYQFDAYKGNTPLMMVIDLFAHKVADKPKSIWKTAVSGAVKASAGAALMVVGLAFALRAKNNWYVAKLAQPKAPRVRFGDAQRVGADDVGEDEVDAKANAAQPRVRLQHPPHQDQTDAIRQKMVQDERADQYRAAQEQKELDAQKKGVAGSWMPYAQQMHNLTEQVHNVRYHDIKPVLRTVEEAAMDIKNRADAFAASAHGAVEDFRDAMHNAKKESKDLSKKAKDVLKSTDQAAKQVSDTAAQAEQTFEKIGVAADQATGFFSNASAITTGLSGFGLLVTGLWSGWHGFKNIKSLVGLPQRTQDINKYRSLITDILHRKDLQLGVQNSDGETALQMVRRYMAENVHDRENYELLSEIERLIMICSV